MRNFIQRGFLTRKKAIFESTAIKKKKKTTTKSKKKPTQPIPNQKRVPFGLLEEKFLRAIKKGIGGQRGSPAIACRRASGESSMLRVISRKKTSTLLISFRKKV